MKKFVITAAAVLLSTAAFANTLSLKDSNSNGSAIGKASSSATHNGDWVSGNGTSDVDQTTTPHSRADAVHAAQGSDNGNPGNSDHSTHGNK
jgi:hypothetical protein